MDVETGKLDWVVNGYETLQSPLQPAMAKTDFAAIGVAGSFKDFEMGEMKFPEMKIGDAAARTELSEIKPTAAPASVIKIQPLTAAPVSPPKIPLPPPIRPRIVQQPWRR